MGVIIGTVLFAAAGGLGALSAPLWAKSQVDLVRILCFTAAFCCWLSWVLIYMAQLNPLIVPTRNIKKE
ncbi:V-type H+-transporting ATPase subunit H [Trypanosoma grayi]|uniref:V-type H+-transporting ATPase subunit H n=1 Tax=Trypanosoma grayi TaxID=71804 RepID=UPI0004F45C31|nr:V-type H+-transporting ATPase subunit H [Trypanosoma grayi]KEG11868.1 V-type H+-transporting ATPase subunit H [Trypanosoma grayi]